MKHHISYSDDMTFWEHLDLLRVSLIKIVIGIVLCSFIAFLSKEKVFAIFFAPNNSDFVTYRLFNYVTEVLTGKTVIFSPIQLINTGLAEQFIVHMKTSVYVGFLLSSPYTLFLLFHFISPALYEYEKKYSFHIIGSGYLMFLLGVLLNYYLIFPLTFRFLGTYQVSSTIINMITLQSYMDTLVMMSLLLGIVFEFPILCWILAKLGFLRVEFMRRYRKHSIVVILFISAIITPTSDVFTLLLVAFPIWLLYEISILIVRLSVKPYVKLLEKK